MRTRTIQLPNLAVGRDGASWNSGIPAVATDIPGNREIIINERTGLLVPVDDTKALADSILKLLRDNGLRKQMGQAARNRIIEKYSIVTVVDRVCDLYAFVMPEKNP